jgi:hypothetical protein
VKVGGINCRLMVFIGGCWYLVEFGGCIEGLWYFMKVDGIYLRLVLFIEDLWY